MFLTEFELLFIAYCVFRFLFGRGTVVHLPSQENEIQPISQQPTSVSKFIICLFRHAEGSPLGLPQTVDKPHSYEGLNGVLFERIVIFRNCDEKMCKYGIFVGIMVIL